MKCMCFLVPGSGPKGSPAFPGKLSASFVTSLLISSVALGFVAFLEQNEVAEVWPPCGRGTNAERAELTGLQLHLPYRSLKNALGACWRKPWTVNMVF